MGYRRYFPVFSLALLLVITAGGCAAEEGETGVVDQMGRQVEIDGTPERIISLSPSNTEVLFALGLGDRLVGVTEYCNYPPEAAEKTVVGGFEGPSVELVVELRPDLVVASTMQREAVTVLESMDIPVVVVESAAVEDLYRSVALLAAVCAVEAAGEELINGLRDRLAAVGEIVAGVEPADRVTVYLEVYPEPLISAGGASLVHEVINLAGGENIFADIDDNYPVVSSEAVVERAPAVILYFSGHGTAEMIEETMTGRPGWESIPALEEKRVYAVPQDPFSRPGPRLGDAVEEAARLFYPHLF